MREEGVIGKLFKKLRIRNRGSYVAPTQLFELFNRWNVICNRRFLYSHVARYQDCTVLFLTVSNLLQDFVGQRGKSFLVGKL
jgi:hypothetical protein